jgi:polyisoprenoid-binding protein YceI
MPITYVFDPRRSRFTVQVSASGALSAFAHSPTIAIRDFTGEFKANSPPVDNATLSIVIKAASLEVSDSEISAKDRAEIERTMRASVLETDRFPEIRFHSTDIAATALSENRFRLQITGQLAMHGVTGTLAFEAQLLEMGAEIRLGGTFALLQSAYQIKRPAAALGLIIAKDELKFSFDIVAQVPQ